MSHISDNALVIPMVVHIAWVVFLYAALTAVRAPSVWGVGRRRDGTDPFETLEPKIAANLRNQFEWPLLFYVVCILVIVQGCKAPSAYLWLAWIFVLGRFLHTGVQVFTENIRLRGIVFTINFIAVLGMWFVLLT